MSAALNDAIAERLRGVEVLTGALATAQQFLADTLATDPDTALPAVQYGNLNTAPLVKDADQVRMPVVTFRASGGIPDGRFAHGLLVDDDVYDFEVWNFTEDALTIPLLWEAIETLLDRRKGAPQLPLGSGECVWAETFVVLSTLYDEQRNGWFGLVRVRFIEGRA